MDTPVTVTNELLDAYKAAPAPVQKLILSDTFTTFLGSLSAKFKLSPEVAATVSDELLLFLLGSVPPEELLGQLFEIDDLDEGVAVEILEAFSKEVIAPLGTTTVTRTAPSVAPINRLQTSPKPVAPAAPIKPTVPLVAAKPAMPPVKPAAPKMDIHPVEKHLELPPHQVKAPPAPKPRPYVPPPAPMRTMKTDEVASKKMTPPPMPPAPRPVPPPPPKPPAPPAADASKKPTDPYREPIE